LRYIGWIGQFFLKGDPGCPLRLEHFQRRLDGEMNEHVAKMDSENIFFGGEKEIGVEEMPTKQGCQIFLF
jgi:hypothetical protein